MESQGDIYMALDKLKTEAGHKAGRTGRKGTHRADRKVAANHQRRVEDRTCVQEATHDTVMAYCVICRTCFDCCRCLED